MSLLLPGWCRCEAASGVGRVTGSWGVGEGGEPGIKKGGERHLNLTASMCVQDNVCQKVENSLEGCMLN